MKRTQAGFTLVESLVAVVLFGIAILGFMSVYGLYFGLVAQAKQQQEIESHVDSLIATFRTGTSCTDHLQKLWGSLPHTISKAQFDFSEIMVDGVNIKLTDGTFPRFPSGKLTQVSLDLPPPPAGQVAVRADVTIYYKMKNSDLVRKNKLIVYLGLDNLGRVERCLDVAAYRRMDAQEKACLRIGGTLEGDRHCNAMTSALVKKRLCEAMNIHYVNEECALK